MGNENIRVKHLTDTLFELESILSVQVNEKNIYDKACDWIFKNLDASFVLFYNLSTIIETNHVKYYNFKAQSYDRLCDVSRERLQKENKDLPFYIHSDKSVSTTIKYPDESEGYMIVGSKTSGKDFDDEEYIIINTIKYILMNAFRFIQTQISKKEKDRVVKALDSITSPDIVDDIIHGKESLHPDDGQECDISIIFTDLCNFTPLVENMDPKDMFKVLNIYLNEMTHVIQSLGGTIDKYEGDAIMAYFGAPRAMEDHALRCCLAALRMKRFEEVLNKQLMFEQYIKEPLCTRIGVNSGKVLIGKIGSTSKLEYTVIGRDVNIASRIEETNKNFITENRILISNSTYNLVKEYFECRYVADAALKGIAKPVPLYEIKEEITDKIPMDLRVDTVEDAMGVQIIDTELY